MGRSSWVRGPPARIAGETPAHPGITASSIEPSMKEPEILCPACGEPLSKHVQSEIGSAIIGSEDDERLAGLIARREWWEARRFQSANAIADIRVWRLIRCSDGRTGVVALIMPIEIWSDDYYEEPEFLSEPERDELFLAFLV